MRYEAWQWLPNTSSSTDFSDLFHYSFWHRASCQFLPALWTCYLILHSAIIATAALKALDYLCMGLLLGLIYRKEEVDCKSALIFQKSRERTQKQLSFHHTSSYCVSAPLQRDRRVVVGVVSVGRRDVFLKSYLPLRNITHSWDQLLIIWVTIELFCVGVSAKNNEKKQPTTQSGNPIHSIDNLAVPIHYGFGFFTFLHQST